MKACRVGADGSYKSNDVLGGNHMATLGERILIQRHPKTHGNSPKCTKLVRL